MVFDEDPSFKAILEDVAPVKLVDGITIPVKTAFEVVKEDSGILTHRRSI